MTHAEVYAELEKDLENLSRWVDRKTKEIRRYALKQDSRNFPIVLTGSYVSPRRIRYDMIVIIRSRGGARWQYVYAMRQTPNGKEVYICKSYDGSTLPKVVFIPHALKRYAERTNSDKTGEDLVRRMLIRSIECAVSRNQKLGSKSVRYKGDMLLTFCIREGAWLGKMEGDIYVVNTFITYDMMCGLQKEELSKHREIIERGPDAADDLILKFNNRRTLRTNQPINMKTQVNPTTKNK